MRTVQRRLFAGVDRSTADPNDPSSFGRPVWDSAFDFKDARVQLAVLAACDAILAARDTLAFTPSAGRRECAMQAFVRDAGGKDAVRWGDQAGLVSFTFNTSMQFSYQKLPKVFSFDP